MHTQGKAPGRAPERVDGTISNAAPDLDDSWFKWPKPPTLRPPPDAATVKERAHPPVLADRLADAWFV